MTAPTTQTAQVAPTMKISTFADLAAVLGPIEYDWKPWIPIGMLGLLVSISGEGKSCVLMRIAGCYILRLDWPDGMPFVGPTGSVLWCEAEAAHWIRLSPHLMTRWPM